MTKKENNPNLQWLRQEFLNLRQELSQFRKDSIDNDLKLFNHIGELSKSVGCLEGKVKTLMWGVPIAFSVVIGVVLIFIRILI